MPSILSRRSRNVASDDDEPVIRAQTPSSVAPQDSKRAHRDHVHEDPSLPFIQRHRKSRVSLKPVSRTSRGELQHNGTVPPGLSQHHQPGAIVRVTLRNFVTYTFIEFFPGPNLNMIIGPNGSGKSTLVCAICLGLGWGSQHLGRARDVSEFVKTGSREAKIEIELQKDGNHSSNPVFTRVIRKEGNKSTFSLNGSAKPRKDIQEFARSMNIQIDNLCQFLPQDKVVEFAAMTPVELLQSTQRAAAAPEMLQLHEDLKNLRARQKEIMISSRGDREDLRNLEGRQEMQRADVERLKQRDQIKRKVAWMEKCRPIPRYQDAKAKVRAARERRNILTADLKALTAEVAPALRRVNQTQAYENQVQKAVRHGREITAKASLTAENVLKKIAGLEQSLKDFDGMKEAEQKGIKTKKEDKHRHQNVISRIKKQMEAEPEDFDPKATNDKIAELNARNRQLADTSEDINEQLHALKRRGEAKLEEKQADHNHLTGLDTQAGQREHQLQELSRDSHAAWKWIQANQDKFEHQVFGPAMVECSLKDPKYANAIESLFQENDFKAFTAQSRNDFYTLQRVLNREMKLTDVSLRVCSNSSMDQFEAPLSDSELRSCGMEGWAIDFLDGPDVVLAMLCGEKFLHSTSVTLQDITQDQYSFLENSNVRSWVVNGTLFQAVRRREYGLAGNSTRTRALREARVWTTRPVDLAAKAHLQQRIKDAESEVATIREEIKGLVEGKRELAKQSNELGEEINSLKAEKEERQKALTIFKALPTKLAQEEEKVAAIEEHLGGVRERIDKIQKDRDKVLLEKAETTLKYVQATAEIRNAHDALLELEIQHLEAKSDFETLKARNEHVQATLKAKQAEEKAAAEESTQANADARELVVHVKNLAAEAKGLAEAGEMVWQDYLAEYGSRSAEQLEADIESEKARFELTHEGNHHILKEFDDRQRRIDKLKQGLETFMHDKREFERAISEIRGKWEPELDALVVKISDAFSDSFARIGCAGQVTVYKASSSDKEDDIQRPAIYSHAGDTAASNGSNVNGNGDGEGNGVDFANWAIHISVKFRESEALSLLDSHRQSGGERAVSTIFYLMALQSLSRAPFRVVDEINQGMDPRNERMVHGRMVDIACGAADEDDSDNGDDISQNPTGPGSQYFLITPKLLSGLKYRRGMRVLNIVGGDKMYPSCQAAGTAGQADRVDFATWVSRARELGLAEMMAGINSKDTERADPGIRPNPNGYLRRPTTGLDEDEGDDDDDNGDGGGGNDDRENDPGHTSEVNEDSIIIQSRNQSQLTPKIAA